MSQLKVRLLAAFVATATLASVGSAAKADTKKKQFADLLSASVSTATASSPGAYAFTPSRISAERAATSSYTSSISASTLRPPGLSLRAFRGAVRDELRAYRSIYLADLLLLRAEYRTGQITFNQFLALRNSETGKFLTLRNVLVTEFRTGIPAGPLGPLTVLR